MSNTSKQQWYCLRVQPKREAIAAAGLKKHGVEVLAPKLRYLKMTKRGKVWWEEALFPAYILAKFDLLEQKNLIQYSMAVSGIVHFGDEFPPVPEHVVVELVRYLEENGGEIIEVTPKVQLGDTIEVGEGPMKGMSGEVVEVLPGTQRVNLLMEFLGQENIIEFDLYSLLVGKPTIE